VFRNYEGKRFVYKQPKVGVEVGCDAEGSPDIVPIEVGKRTKRARGKKAARG
jgi:hypothetical protein